MAEAEPARTVLVLSVSSDMSPTPLCEADEARESRNDPLAGRSREDPAVPRECPSGCCHGASRRPAPAGAPAARPLGSAATPPATAARSA